MANPKRKYLQRYSGNGFLVESIVIAGKPVYAVVKSNRVAIEKNIDEYYPSTSDLSRPYNFKSEKEFNDTLEAAKHETLDTLFQKVSLQWKKYSCADEFENAICAADTIFTYYQSCFGMTHYLFFVGSPDSGKSNKLHLFNVLAYRNFMSSDMTAANIYRHLGSIQEGQGTICEDEVDDLDDNREKMKIYKNGYVSGVRVPRNDKEGLTSMVQSGYFTYCWKAFAAERLPDSTKAKGLKSRVIEINCISDIPDHDISEVLNPALADEFVSLNDRLFELRNLLFCYMLIHCNDKFPNIRLNITNREKQLFKPLIRLFQGTRTQPYLLKVISHFVNERRKSNTDSLLSFLYTIVSQLVADHGEIVESALIWKTIVESLEGAEIPYKPMSYDSTDYGIISQKMIVEMIRDNFKAKPPSRHGTKRSLQFDKTVLEQLESKYASVEVQVTEIGTDGTDGTDIDNQEDIEIIDKRQVGDTYSSSLTKYDNNMSHPSQDTEFEHVLEGLKRRRIKNNPSQASQPDDADVEGVS